MIDTTTVTWIDIISYIDMTLTIFGGWALIKIIVFLFFYFIEKNQYMKCIYKHYYERDTQGLPNQKNYHTRRISHQIFCYRISW